MRDDKIASPATDAAEVDRRLAVLAQCREAEQRWQQQPGRMLMLFFDGTGNMLGNNRDTNVVKLFRAVDKTPEARQIAYYDPGVGSANDFPAVDPLESRLRGMAQLVGLALGRGVFDNIAEGYRFLAEHYRDGDRICIFGFSRGAFTARAVAGMANMYGLVHPAGLAILPSMVRSYFSQKRTANRAGVEREEFAQDVLSHFSLGRTPLIHFIGVWDTVESVGIDLFGRGLKISNNPTIAGKRFVHVRHALALHETREKYAPRNYTAPGFDAEEQRHRSFDERWFRGNHSDVGGSYAEAGLSNITLRWMMDEAAACGLRFGPEGAGRIDPHQPMHDQTAVFPFWAWVGLGARMRSAGERLDPTAQPVQEATLAPPIWRTAPKVAWLGVLLAFATAGLGWQAWTHAASACSRGGETFSLLLAQLSAPWLTQRGIHCDTQAVLHALQWDWALGAAYALLLAYPVAWAVRRVVPAAIADGRPLAGLTRHARWLMLGLVAADAAENLLSHGLFGGANGWALLMGMGLSLASVIKFGCLAGLLKVVIKPG
ncbi:DUF2235 domain-containing protein [Polaromonas sp. A23]|uniref:DUF2235 domain-containing protein n=1 Tax=Polaromonas sp. A23 TaxID=1944133 RepID=UPI0009871ACC|nr:DUF2235 domain-containing protein [Polaromonas sp. A23]OOG38497.1 hypothetical protein B0B52_16615 [Polaromonas sp. A23]